VPTAGDLAPSARDLLTVYKEPHGTEQHDGFLKDPVMVNSLFLKKPERIEVLGRIFLLALLLWRLMERAMRTSVDTTSTPLTGWDKKATERPTSFMMVTKFAGGIVLKLGDHRPLARPLSGVQPQYLTALNVPVACCTDCTSG
jgi:transposase